MPYFDFTIVSSHNKTKRNYKIRTKNTIIESNVIGYVTIDLDANYYVVYNDKSYKINPINYSCKGFITIYNRFLDENNHRIRIIRVNDSVKAHHPYLPFAPGCVVKGNITVLNDLAEIVFDIKKCYIDKEDATANYYLKHFKDNYNIIKDKIKQKLMNNDFF